MTLTNGHSTLQADSETATAYQPLSSIWEGSDRELLDAMLEFSPTINPDPILDATYNTGRIWRGSSRDVVSMDIDSTCCPMVHASFSVTPCSSPIPTIPLA